MTVHTKSISERLNLSETKISNWATAVNVWGSRYWWRSHVWRPCLCWTINSMKSNTVQRRAFLFQQEDGKLYSTGFPTAWFCNKIIWVLNWPSCSPDPSPIENRWSIIKWKVRQRRSCWTTEIPARMGKHLASKTAVGLSAPKSMQWFFLEKRWCNTPLNVLLSQLLWKSVALNIQMSVHHSKTQQHYTCCLCATYGYQTHTSIG